jgi:hypothetical protein
LSLGIKIKCFRPLKIIGFCFQWHNFDIFSGLNMFLVSIFAKLSKMIFTF